MNAVYGFAERMAQGKALWHEPLTGGERDNKQFNNFVTSGPLTEFYDPATQKPFFPGKLDGKAYATEEAMRKNNPGGYDFGVKSARELPKYHAKWLKALAKEK